jgi:hypothetical protein
MVNMEEELAVVPGERIGNISENDPGTPSSELLLN